MVFHIHFVSYADNFVGLYHKLCHQQLLPKKKQNKQKGVMLDIGSLPYSTPPYMYKGALYPCQLKLVV